MDTVTKENLIELAKKSEAMKELDWGMIPIEEDRVYDTIASAVLTNYTKVSPEYKELVIMTSCLALNVQNFVLRQQNEELLRTISKLKDKK